MKNNRHSTLRKALSFLLLVSMFSQQTGMVTLAEDFPFTDQAEEQTAVYPVQAPADPLGMALH